MDATVARVVADLASPPIAWHRPVLVAITGLPCTGKTELATCLAAHFPLIVLSTDAIRRAYGLPSGPSAHGIMYAVAAVLLKGGAGVVFDGIHLGRRNRDEARAFAQVHGAECEVIYATASQSVIERRLRARRTSPIETAAAGKFVIGPDHFERIRQHLEVPTPDEAAWTVDTSARPAGALPEPLRKRLGALLPPPGRDGGYTVGKRAPDR
jgi:predicted kinase